MRLEITKAKNNNDGSCLIESQIRGFVIRVNGEYQKCRWIIQIY